MDLPHTLYATSRLSGILYNLWICLWHDFPLVLTKSLSKKLKYSQYESNSNLKGFTCGLKFNHKHAVLGKSISKALSWDLDGHLQISTPLGHCSVGCFLRNTALTHDMLSMSDFPITFLGVAVSLFCFGFFSIHPSTITAVYKFLC